ncbi:MAG: M56 family metallopeptidase [Candidatus Marinimicrobia bacterium]|nr:M56 family metallopeptidase [Candidatus Neomarinimicrobiota bacterium]
MIDLLNYISNHWWSYFFPLVIQNTLFLAIIYGALIYLKKIPVRTRYSIALLGLIKLLIPAFIPISILAVPQISKINQAIFLAPVTATAVPRVLVPESIIFTTTVIMLIWLSITIMMLAAPLITLGRIKYRLKKSELIEYSSADSNRNIQMYKTDCVTLPMTIGILSKRIYVPIMWDSWSKNHQEIAIRHEMTHINRHDGFISGIQMVAQAIYFFHPLVWLLNRQINELREMVCDEIAQGKHEDSSIIYSRFLVDVAENMVLAQVDCPTINSLVKKKKELLNRIQYLLEDKMQLNRGFKRFLMPVLISLAILLSWNCQSQVGKQGVSPEGDIQAQIVAVEDTETQPEMKYIPYDTPPEPIGGYAAIKSNVVYPELATKAGIEGTVIVQAFIDETGQVTSTKILKSIPDTGLDEAAAAALEKTAFKPAYQREDPVGVWISVPVNFRLRDKTKVESKVEKGVIINSNEVNLVRTPEEIAESMAKLAATKAFYNYEPKNKVKFIPYDTPPEPIGGYAAIQENIVYPELAQKAGIEGTVFVQAFVDETGKVDEAIILKGVLDTGLDGAAIAAIEKTIFKPAFYNDQAVGCWIAIPINFALKESDQLEKTEK